MHTVREEETVRTAVNDAFGIWSMAEAAWEACTYAVAHDPHVGVPLNETGSVRSYVFDGARSIDMPSVDVIYTIDAGMITIQHVRFQDAPYPQAGHA